MIVSIRGRLTEDLLVLDRCPKGFPADLFQGAKRKLQMIVAARVLKDLLVPPGNHLEALAGNRKGQHSIRINGQWRICFRWTTAGAEDVEVVDHH